MTDVESIRAALIVGAIAGVVLSLVAFLLSRFVGDIVGRALLATVLFTAAGAYFGFAVVAPVSRIWLLIEFLQCFAFGTMALVGWRGSAKWLALGLALHPVWDFGVHYIGPANFAPRAYAIACISLDWVVAAYILIRYRGATALTPSPAR